MISFDDLEKNRDTGSLIAYLKDSSRLYLSEAGKLASICDQALPVKPSSFEKMKEILVEMSQLLSNGKIMSSIEQILSEAKMNASEKIGDAHFGVWKRATERGRKVFNSFIDLSAKIKNDNHILPMIRVTRQTSQLLKKSKEDFFKINLFLRHMYLMVITVAKGASIFPHCLKRNIVVSPKSKNALLFLENVAHTLSGFQNEFQTEFKNYVEAFKGGRIDHVEFTKGSLPAYEDLKDIFIQFLLLLSEMNYFVTGDLPEKDIEILAKAFVRESVDL
ncbi:hypothetical protein GE061_017228 [Apolygus lucorum]|uniref:Uncharacterized protein n=1 Tax=Apolygus lucorum TaxID=248454 RepID=A0A8S9XBT9_APOLU|nr:hypothetical protein GE061_017228 [Apolygus lucorum]